jgi:hypothetical protein
MFRKAFTLVLLGVLLVGAAAVTYGTFFDRGFAVSAAGVLGAGDHDDDDDHGHDDDDD